MIERIKEKLETRSVCHTAGLHEVIRQPGEGWNDDESLGGLGSWDSGSGNECYGGVAPVPGMFNECQVM